MKMIGSALRVALGIIQGSILLDFGRTERLRAFRYPIFMGGVVEGDDICSAAFCENAALRRKLLPAFSRLNPLRRGSGLRGFAVPFGEVGKADRP